MPCIHTKERQNIHQGLRIFFALSLLILTTGTSVFSQRSEVGVFFGGSYYMGDLNPHQHYSLTRIAGGGLFRYSFNEHVALRLNAVIGSVEGSDSIVKYNENRNLSFISNVVEISLQGEVNFLRFEPGDMDTPGTPYIFGGIGGFSFNPKAEMDGRYYELQPLGTEGQGSELYPERDFYSRFSSSILMGIGYKFNITRHITAGIEWGMRRSGTDYIDDVSTTYPRQSVLSATGRFFSDRSLENSGENAGFQRGNPENNDWYSFSGLLLTFKLPSFKKPECPAFN